MLPCLAQENVEVPYLVGYVLDRVVISSFAVQPVIAIERIVYHRERAAGMYAAMPYALAQGDVEIPYLVVQALLWSVITYWMFGFEASAGTVSFTQLHAK